MKRIIVIPWIILVAWITVAFGAPLPDEANAGRTFYLDPTSGNNTNHGLSQNEAWRSPEGLNRITLRAGDRLRIKRGTVLRGSLRIQAMGSEERPVIAEAYGQGAAPVIDSKGYLAGVHVVDSRHVIVRDLEITSDGGPPVDGSSKKDRYGVLVETSRDGDLANVRLEGLFIHDVYPTEGKPLNGRNPLSHQGTGITVRGGAASASTDIVVRGCRIERTGFKAIDLKQLRRVQVLDNVMKDIGGPAIQPGNVDDLLVRGNTVDGSGSSLDPRMHGRGSGIWPWTCNRVLIEKNRFMHARGKADSCGIHIDFNCRDVVVQYNLSVDNEGGFIEILGNNHNCAYRYNISINDGARVKGRDGAHQEGKVLWTSGYVGRGRTKHGPYNSYIYNNTIYVAPGSRSCFSIAPTTEGLLIANNIFHVMGETENVSGDQDKRVDKKIGRIPRATMTNNLYVNGSVLPAGLPVEESAPIIGDARFVRPGGTEPEDYTPRNTNLVRDRGIMIPHIESDAVGLKIGLPVVKDFLGRDIVGRPDLGAIEIPQ
ncbi:MAG: right-handed parallel beta-helix repeat-containing protein [Planctomycetota bacterium]|jgi:hypothetical protein